MESLKYPVILVHGIAVHDRSKIIDFWGRIPETFREKGNQVYYGNTDAWGGCDSNAKILKETIEKVLLETGKEKVNIIAHSKGGIDSRWLIRKYGFEDRIASLTTVSTPHRGSELADLIYKQKVIHYKIFRKTLDIFGKLYGDTNPDLYNVNFQLTSGKMKEFNENVKMSGKVYFQSLYTTMRNSFDDLMFYYTHSYIKKVTGENDGMVSEQSARWGDNTAKIEDGISHAEIIDYKKKNISGKNIPGIYMKIINELRMQGF